MDRSHNDLNDREMTIAKQASPLLGTLAGTNNFRTDFVASSEFREQPFLV